MKHRRSAASPSDRAKPQRYQGLLSAIELATRELTGRAVQAVNQALVLRNWVVGAYLVEFEQRGADRATYGARLLERLAKDLSARGVRGLDARTLRDCRSLYQVYPQLRGSASPVSRDVRRALSWPSAANTGNYDHPAIRGAVSPESRQLPPRLSADLVLRLSWSILLELVAIDDPWKRAFYENQCLEGRWSVRQLGRQIETLLYERTGISTRRIGAILRAQPQALPSQAVDLIRDPYVLEFTGLAERAEYSELDLETSLLDHLQRFLLELGTGFCFEARQFRITVNRKHDRVDLVFYHRLLRCHVLFELKVRAFRHTDAGQMNFYLNWFRAKLMCAGDNPPVGVILCSDRDRTEVEFATAGMDNRLFVSRYLTVLPSAEQLKAVIERDRARLHLPATMRRRGRRR